MFIQDSQTYSGGEFLGFFVVYSSYPSLLFLISVVNAHIQALLGIVLAKNLLILSICVAYLDETCNLLTFTVLARYKYLAECP